MDNYIDSRQNPKIKYALRLKNAKTRKADRKTLIEGQREIAHALESGIKIQSLFYNTEYCRDSFARKSGIPDNIVFRLSKRAFDAISFRENPDGLIAIAEVPDTKLSDLRLNKNSLVLVLESIEKPGNLGAIMRTADAAGLDAVIISMPAGDIYGPNAIRASQGTVFTNQIAADAASDILDWLEKNNFTILAASPRARTIYTAADYSKNTAIVVGSEDKGLSEQWLKAAGRKIKIPMRGKIDSLNVSVSAAIIIFEALRQRGARDQ